MKFIFTINWLTLINCIFKKIAFLFKSKHEQCTDDDSFYNVWYEFISKQTHKIFLCHYFSRGGAMTAREPDKAVKNIVGEVGSVWLNLPGTPVLLTSWLLCSLLPAIYLVLWDL